MCSHPLCEFCDVTLKVSHDCSYMVNSFSCLTGFVKAHEVQRFGQRIFWPNLTQQPATWDFQQMCIRKSWKTWEFQHTCTRNPWAFTEVLKAVVCRGEIGRDGVSKRAELSSEHWTCQHASSERHWIGLMDCFRARRSGLGAQEVQRQTSQFLNRREKALTELSSKKRKLNAFVIAVTENGSLGCFCNSFCQREFVVKAMFVKTQDQHKTKNALLLA